MGKVVTTQLHDDIGGSGALAPLILCLCTK